METIDKKELRKKKIDEDIKKIDSMLMMKRLNQCLELKKKLIKNGITNDYKEMKIFDEASNNYIKNNVEFDDIIYFEDLNINLVVKMKSGSKILCSALIKKLI